MFMFHGDPYISIVVSVEQKFPYIVTLKLYFFLNDCAAVMNVLSSTETILVEHKHKSTIN